MKPSKTLQYLLLGIFLLTSCAPEKTTTYVCKAGQHDFRPSPVPFPFAAKTMTGLARLDSSCWYNSLGVDNQDWNKLSGVYRWVDGYKNINSFILAWRPDTLQRGLFSLILYENIAGANVPHESAVYKVRAGQGFSFWFLESGGKYTLWINGNVIGTQQNDRIYKTVSKVSAWFGGNRKAPHDMSMQLSF